MTFDLQCFLWPHFPTHWHWAWPYDLLCPIEYESIWLLSRNFKCRLPDYCSFPFATSISCSRTCHRSGLFLLSGYWMKAYGTKLWLAHSCIKCEGGINIWCKIQIWGLFINIKMTYFKSPMNAEIPSDIYQKALGKCMTDWMNNMRREKIDFHSVGSNCLVREIHWLNYTILEWE